MKNAALVFMLLIGMTVMAQRGEGHHRDAMKDLTPEQAATLQTKRMTLALDLSQAQQSKIQALNLANAELRKSNMEERKSKNENGEVKKPTTEERYAMQNQRLDHQIAQKAEIKNILSEEQFEKWTKLKAKKSHHRRGKMHNKREARR